MRDPRNREGARALLLERLVDEDPRAFVELRPLRTHDPAGLKASVLRRLTLLLNTRAPQSRPVQRDLTVLDYGLPDFTGLYTHDPRARVALAAEIRRTIEAFEPRLQLGEVRLDAEEGEVASLRVVLTGLLRGEAMAEPVSFVVPLGAPEEGRP